MTWLGPRRTRQELSAAFLYRNATMTDLNSLIPRKSGWNLLFAYGINENGQIVGYGTFNGQSRAFLLDPDRKHRCETGGEAPLHAPTERHDPGHRHRRRGGPVRTGPSRQRTFPQGEGHDEMELYRASVKPGANVFRSPAQDTAGNSLAYPPGGRDEVVMGRSIVEFLQSRCLERVKSQMKRYFPSLLAVLLLVSRSAARNTPSLISAPSAARRATPMRSTRPADRGDGGERLARGVAGVFCGKAG